MREDGNQYRAFGLQIKSEYDLPELHQITDSRTAPDVRIGEFDETALEGKQPVPWFERYDTGRVYVTDGRDILIDTNEIASPETLRQLILGPGLRTVLHQRNNLVIHGSAVTKNGRAIAFIGDSGSGKSTTAGVFANNGYKVVADDIVVPEPESGEVRWGLSSVKLDRSAAKAVFDGKQFDTSMAPERQYYTIDLTEKGDRPVLDYIYILTEGEEYTIESVTPREAVYELMSHSYGDYEPNDEDNEPVIDHFRQCAKIAETSRLRRLCRPLEFEGLPRVVELVKRDVGTN